jgi:hypothetical protein
MPDLKVFPLDRDDVSLREGYLVQQPICACVIGDIFHAFGIKHLPDKAMSAAHACDANE